MKCKRCRKEIDDGAAFCSFCGFELSAQAEEEDLFREISSSKEKRAADELNETEKKLKRASKIVRPVSIVLVILSAIVNLFGLSILGGFLIVPVLLSEGILLYNKRKLYQNKDALRLDGKSTEEKECEAPIRKESESIDNAEKEIKSYLITGMLWNAVLGFGTLLFGCLLFFLPFFSVIVADVSVFDLTKESMLWESLQSDSKEYVYRELLLDVFRECKLLGVVDLEEFAEIYFPTSILSVMFFAFIPLILCLYYGYLWYKFTNVEDYKRAIIYRYGVYSSQKRSPSTYYMYRVLVLAIVVLLSLPTMDFFITLPRYFDGLTDSFYYVCLIFFVLFVIAVYAKENIFALGKKHNAIAWAFAKDKQIK